MAIPMNSTIEMLIAASATLKVYQRTLPMPMSTNR
jgi:hypothetical protein